MHDLITLWSSFLAGLFSAITPCNYVLFPILLYQFGLHNIKQRVRYKKIILFTSIFLFIIVLTGLFFSVLIPYTIFKFLFGGFLIIWGLYQLKNPGTSFIKNNNSQLIVLATLTPFVVTLSPCSLPFFSAFITLQNTVPKINIVLNFLSFGIGLLTPSLLLALLGNRFSKFVHKTYQLTNLLDKIAGFLIIFSGFYFIYQIQSIDKKDIFITGGIIILLTLLYFSKVITKKRSLLFQKFLIFIFSWIMFTISIILCSQIVPQSVQASTTCQVAHTCSYCQLCGVVFIVYITITAYLYQYVNKKIVFLIKE